MIFGKRRGSGSIRGGFYHFVNPQSKSTLSGYGDGDFVRLRDEYGLVWTGTAEKQGPDLIRYRLRSEKGKTIAGISDTHGIVLRDEKGNTWRGFLE